MSEKTMWGHLRKRVFLSSDHDWHAERVENRCCLGMPDVNWACSIPPEPQLGIPNVRAEGWIELKELKAWPKRPETVVHIEHYTQDQRIWARTRAMAGGNVTLLLKVKREWLLFDGTRASHVVGLCDKQTLFRNASAFWFKGLDGDGLKRQLILQAG